MIQELPSCSRICSVDCLEMMEVGRMIWFIKTVFMGSQQYSKSGKKFIYQNNLNEISLKFQTDLTI
jgi:hypothetical protein